MQHSNGKGRLANPSFPSGFSIVLLIGFLILSGCNKNASSSLDVQSQPERIAVPINLKENEQNYRNLHVISEMAHAYSLLVLEAHDDQGQLTSEDRTALQAKIGSLESNLESQIANSSKLLVGLNKDQKICAEEFLFQVQQEFIAYRHLNHMIEEGSD